MLLSVEGDAADLDYSSTFTGALRRKPKAEPHLALAVSAVPTPACMRRVPTGVRRLLPAARPVLSAASVMFHAPYGRCSGTTHPVSPARPPARVCAQGCSAAIGSWRASYLLMHDTCCMLHSSLMFARGCRGCSIVARLQRACTRPSIASSSS